MLQDTIDRLDVIGRWDWDIGNDRVYADATVALLFSVDPALAEAGTPIVHFLNGMHSEDREETVRLITRCAEGGRSYLAEYRVISADGNTRLLLARGHFTLDQDGVPKRGNGILIDVTQKRIEEVEHASGAVLHSDHPLNRAAEHCLAAHKALNEMPKSVLHHMSATLLMEIGRQIVSFDRAEYLRKLN
ncbi:PAS domain-containing protein [Methylobacterium sp. WL69]|uniref:PAS domain-containing protein n=1 Tax=Methylobacterium sp. WL69 TaxID=2603893 RepID=UPI0011CB50B8|nr:PAS domain-containing protein [Methylobacterium sp. WL69]TXM76597.1 PAS domain-containing protein [Methylobacterium sp. WL69]